MKKTLALPLSLVALITFYGCEREAETTGEITAGDPNSTTEQGRNYEAGDQTLGEEPDAGTAAAGTQQQAGQPGVQQSGAATDFGSYQDWDTDQSGDVTQTEFETRFESFQAWTEWDSDGDQSLDETEAANVQWSLFDDDDDAMLAEEEWRQGVERLGIQAQYTEADRDGDGHVSQGEFTQWFEQKAWTEWDANGDGMVGREEAADALWNMWDRNDDDKLEENEWRQPAQA